jgi:hypothetical protein
MTLAVAACLLLGRFAREVSRFPRKEPVMNTSSTLVLLSCVVVVQFLILGLVGWRSAARPATAAMVAPRRSIAVRGSRIVVLKLRIELEVEEDGSVRSPCAVRLRPVAMLPAEAAPKPVRRAGRFRAFLAWVRWLAPATLARGTAKVPGLCLRLAAGLW